LSNHKPYSAPNRSLALAFGIEFLDAFFHTVGKYTSLENELLNIQHPVISGVNPPSTVVQSIITNTCDAINFESGNVFASLPVGMNDRLGKGMVSEGTAFGIAKEWGKGRVVAVADSGLFGNPGTMYPGPGLLDEGDNRQFLSNILHFLLRKSG
jgi:hypothetical protein